MGRRVARPPKIFAVNWFRKDAQGRFVWPGFGENMRVLQWIVGRCAGTADAVETPLGRMPRYDDLYWAGLAFGPDRYEAVTHVDRDEWSRELVAHDELFDRIGPKCPSELATERDRLAERLSL